MPEAPAGAARRDVVFTFSYESWDDAVARGMMRPPDRILGSLLTADAVGRLLIANPYRSVAGLLRPHAARPDRPGTRLVTPRRLRRADPVDLPALERTYRHYAAGLRRTAGRFGMRDPLLLTTHPLVAGLGEFGDPARTLYFARDDWASSPARRAYRPAYELAYRRMAEAGVRVAAVSQQIVDRIGSPASLVVPNGIDAAEWAGKRPPPPEWLAALPGPIAIYAGSIDRRVDAAGLAALAAARPHVSFVLLGPVIDTEHVRPLRAFDNVTLHPSVGRAELVAAVRNADAALVAHVRSPLTEAMSPLKAYEYVAAGLPVVSIDLPPMRLLGSAVRFAPSVAEFGPALDAAIAEGRAAEDARLEFVRRNSWQARHERLLQFALAPRQKAAKK